MRQWSHGSTVILLLGVLAWTDSATGTVDAVSASARTGSLAGSGCAIFWDESGAGSANPALLGYGPGVSFSWSELRQAEWFIQSLPYPARHTGSARRLRLSYGGVGVRLAGPLALGPGASIIRSESAEESEEYAAGLSLLQVVTGLAGTRGGVLSSVGKHVDFGFGLSRSSRRTRLHRVDAAWSPWNSSTDYGLHGRISSGRLTPSGSTAQYEFERGLRFEFGAAFVFENRGASRGTDIGRRDRRGVAGRAVLQLSDPSTSPRWLDPELAVGIAQDWVRVEESWSDRSGAVRQSFTRWGSAGTGIELTALGLVSLRHSAGRIGEQNWGFGVHLPVGARAHLYWDHQFGGSWDTSARNSITLRLAPPGD